jgi:acid phosphatase
MKKLLFLIFSVTLLSCEEEIVNPGEQPEPANPDIARLPVPDHMIFVWLENKGYTQIIGSPEAPYINSLVPQGTLFMNAHALSHPSYPEYIRFFSGSSQGKHDDNCISGKPYYTPNLYTQLAAKGKTFAWYSEDLPSTGWESCQSGDYLERHNPTTVFQNVPPTANKRFADFPTNYSLLEDVVCITPNMENDMHNGSISQGDTWIKNNLKPLVEWCKTHNSVFFIYFDEDNWTSINHIPVIAVGEPVKKAFKDSTRYDHYNFTRTILEIHGAQQIANTFSRETIKSCWK